MKNSILTPIAFALVATLTFACSSASESGDSSDDALEHGEPAASTALTVDATTKHIEGSFVVGSVSRTFTISKIDWQTRTARWNAKVTRASGTGAVDDRNLAVTIDVARCRGCFTFRVQDEDTQLAALTFDTGRASSLVYDRETARNVEITKVSTTTVETAADEQNAPTAPAGGGVDGGADVDAGGGSSDEELGACSRICSGQPAGCVDDVTEAECNATSFGGTVRCPTTFVFKAGERCP